MAQLGAEYETAARSGSTYAVLHRASENPICRLTEIDDLYFQSPNYKSQ